MAETHRNRKRGTEKERPKKRCYRGGLARHGHGKEGRFSLSKKGAREKREKVLAKILTKEREEVSCGKERLLTGSPGSLKGDEFFA